MKLINYKPKIYNILKFRISFSLTLLIINSKMLLSLPTFRLILTLIYNISTIHEVSTTYSFSLYSSLSYFSIMMMMEIKPTTITTTTSNSNSIILETNRSFSDLNGLLIECNQNTTNYLKRFVILVDSDCCYPTLVNECLDQFCLINNYNSSEHCNLITLQNIKQTLLKHYNCSIDNDNDEKDCHSLTPKFIHGYIACILLVGTLFLLIFYSLILQNKQRKTTKLPLGTFPNLKLSEMKSEQMRQIQQNKRKEQQIMNQLFKNNKSNINIETLD